MDDAAAAPCFGQMRVGMMVCAACIRLSYISTSWSPAGRAESTRKVQELDEMKAVNLPIALPHLKKEGILET